MSSIKVSTLNPKMWGFNIVFKVLKLNNERTVNFKDNTTHNVAEYLVGDDSGVIVLNVWDEHISKFEPGKVYELTEARLTVFMNRMKLTMSRKSEVKLLDEDLSVDESNNVSEKHFEEAPKPFYNQNKPYFKKNY
ncbi:MAG: hypothetical protein JW791_01805 [Nanoarchaeota archaeon]|nr:hypothetical protein [Nanoarchaeota archaeon]